MHVRTVILAEIVIYRKFCSSIRRERVEMVPHQLEKYRSDNAEKLKPGISIRLQYDEKKGIDGVNEIMDIEGDTTRALHSRIIQIIQSAAVAIEERW